MFYIVVILLYSKARTKNASEKDAGVRNDKEGHHGKRS
jgi:hypothetical protein